MEKFHCKVGGYLPFQPLFLLLVLLSAAKAQVSDVAIDHLQQAYSEVQHLCQTQRTYTFDFRKFDRDFSFLSSVNICNETMCVSFGDLSFLAAERSFGNSIRKTNEAVGSVFFPIPWIRADSDGLIQSSIFEKSFFTTRQYDPGATLPGSKTPNFFNHLRKARQKIRKQIVPHSSAQTLRFDAVIKGHGLLPSVCDSVVLNNKGNILRFATNSQLIAVLHDKNATGLIVSFEPCQMFTESEYDLPYAIPESSIIRFDLPNYRFCSVTHSSGKEINALDKACLDYRKEVFLKGSSSVSSVNSIALGMDASFAKAFRSIQSIQELATRWHQGQFTTFTAYKLFYDSTAKLCLISKQSSRTFNIPRISEAGWLQETKFHVNMDTIWIDHCYNLKQQNNGDSKKMCGMMDSDTAERSSSAGNQQPSGSRSSSEQGHTNTPTPTSASSMATKDLTATEVSQFPKSPFENGCRVLINEIVPRNDFNDGSYIELVRHCPKGVKQPTGKTLNNFALVILLAGTEISQVAFVNLHRQSWSKVEERKAGRGGRVVNYFAVLGESDTEAMKFEDMELSTGFTLGIPNPEEQVVAVVLLYSGFDHSRLSSHALNGLKLPVDPVTNRHLPTLLDEDRSTLVEQYKQDVVILGPPCSQDECGYLFSLIPFRQIIQGDGDTMLPIPALGKDSNGKVPYHSLSRCSKTTSPMSLEYFKETTATPLASNNCDETLKVLQKYPYSFQSVSLQSTAQRMIVNAKYFFDFQNLEPGLLQGSSTNKIKLVLGIGKTTVERVIANYNKNIALKTPGTVRKNPFKVMSLFNEDRVNQIKKIISNFYAANEAPYFELIFNKFMEDVRTVEATLRSQNRPFTPFKCSKHTFRKVLKKIGFKYGTINKRVVVLLRSDIVARRNEYLKIIRGNRKSSSPRCVIYTDETWVDPHDRTGKGWIPRNPKTLREEARYSFGTAKPGRGSRVIILNAGGSDGFLDGAMDVYQVSKKKVEEDYHNNVDGPYYLKWWKNLNKKIIEKYPGGCFIVIDNAPYHTTSEAPKSRDKKADYYNWLKDNLKEPELSELKEITDYRRADLWSMVRQLKADNPQYIVDNEAKKWGNTVVRLPPYNCDLNPIEWVWSDVKREVRQKNTEATAGFAEDLAKRVMENYPPESWQTHIKKVETLEDKYWMEDGSYDSILERYEGLILPEQRIIIRPNDDDSDDESDDEESDDVLPHFYDAFLASIHDDQIENEDSIFEQRPEQGDIIEEEPVPQSRRRLDDEFANSQNEGEGSAT